MKFLLTLLFVIATLLLSGSSQSFAFVPTGSQIVILPENEIVDGDYFATGEVIDIRGTVNGDVYAAGGQILISGSIGGDLLAAAGQISVSGQVGQSIRAVAGQFQLDGIVGRNLSVVSGFINLLKESQILGNAVLAAGQSNLNGAIGGDVTVATGSTTISNIIGGNLTAYTDKLIFIHDASIQGNLDYTSPNVIPQDSLTPIMGQTAHHHPKQMPQQLDTTQIYHFTGQIKNALNNISSLVRISIVLSQVIVGVFIINILPNFSLRLVSFVEKSPGKSFLTGTITLIVVPIVCSIIAFSIIGIPLVILGITVFFIFIVLAQVLFSYWLGTRFLLGLKRKANRNITFLIGIGIYYVLTSINIIGVIVLILATIFGMGALVLTEYKTYTSARKLKIV